MERATVLGDRLGLLPCGAEARLTAGVEGVTAVRVTPARIVDLHAPMGDAAAVVALDAVEPGKATGARAFQVLHGPHNGSTRGTTFVGYIPPGKAPWHYHLYDEVLWVLRGTGRLHLGDTTEQLSPGSSFRLHAREVHIVENTDPVPSWRSSGSSPRRGAHRPPTSSPASRPHTRSRRRPGGTSPPLAIRRGCQLRVSSAA